MKHWQGDKSLKKASSILGNGLEKTAKVCGISAGIACWCLTILIFLSVIARYVFNYGIVFAADFATYFSCFVIFIGGFYTQWTKGHIRIDFLEKRLPKRAQQWLQIVGLFAILFVSVAYMYYTTIMVWASGVDNLRSITPLPIPLVVPQLPMVIGWFFLIIVVLFQLVKSIMGLRTTSTEIEK